MTSAAGNLGSIVFLLAARYSANPAGSPKVLRIMGVVVVAANLLVAYISTIPKDQLGGR